MKKLFSLAAILLLSSAIFAQVKTTLKEENRSNSNGNFNALVLEIPLTTADKVKDNWESFIKAYKGKTSYSKKDKEIFTDNALIKDMSENTVDIYAKVEDKGDKGSELVVWFNLGVNYLSQKEFPKQFEVAKKMLDKFTETLSANMLEELLKEEEKNLKKLEGEMKDLEKEESKKNKDIADYKDTIKKMEENIKNAESDLKKNAEDKGKKKSEIEEQGKKVEQIKKDIKKSK
jgi:hypothetical protein